MSWKDRQIGASKCIDLTPITAVTTSAANASNQVQAPNGTTIGLIVAPRLTEWVSTGEVWRPLGLQVITTTTTTVTVPNVTLQKNAVNPTAGGVTSMTTLRTAPFSEYASFSSGGTTPNFTGVVFAAGDAAGDKWGVIVSTTSTAGAQCYYLHYACVAIPGLSDAVTNL